MKATLVFAATLIQFAMAEAYGFRCPKFWTEFNGHCYRYFNQPRLTFQDSREYCQTFSLDPEGCSCKRAYLVNIGSSEENAFIHEWWQSLREPTSDGQNVRIGFTDSVSEGTWRWVGGESHSYTNWDLRYGQPDNRRPGQDCGAMWKPSSSSDDGLWDDHTCEVIRPFICEF